MKKNRFVGRAVGLFLVVTMITATFFSCKEDADDLIKPITITDVILQNEEFSILRDIMLYAKMGDSMRTENYTLFAPDNAAFNKANIFASSAITTMPQDSVLNFMKNHIIKTRVRYEDLKVGSVKTIGNKTLAITKVDSSYYINGSEIFKRNVNADNGIIHVIDSLVVRR